MQLNSLFRPVLRSDLQLEGSKPGEESAIKLKGLDIRVNNQAFVIFTDGRIYFKKFKQAFDAIIFANKMLAIFETCDDADEICLCGLRAGMEEEED